jgi:hypothetical protein
MSGAAGRTAVRMLRLPWKVEPDFFAFQSDEERTVPFSRFFIVQ